MIRSKSIQVLKTFSKEELSQFGDFVRSPFHNKKPTLVKLFEVLKKYHPEYEIENEKVYSKIYPGKEYNHDNMKKLMSEKFLLLEKFLLQLNIKKENFTNDKYLLEEYIQRKLNEIFLFKVKKVNEKIDEVNDYIYDFHDKFHLEELIVEFYDVNNITNKIPLETFIKRSEYSLCCFLENLLLDINWINSFRRIYNKCKEAFIFESFLKSLDFKIFLKYLSHNKIKNNFIAFQINLILMLIYPGIEAYFDRAKFFILSDSNNFIKEIYKGFLGFYLNLLENYCHEKIERGVKKYEIELFEINKILLKTILNSYNTMESISYLNLIRRGIKLNKLMWVEEFLKDNTKYLEEKHKENTYNYAKALLEFAKQNYEESLSYASKLKIRTSYYHKMEINVLTLKCYFELSLYDAAFSLIDSSKHYLAKSDEMILEYKEHASRILSIIYKLFRLKIDLNSNTKSDLLNLKSEITRREINHAIYSEWYLQKIEELEKSISVKALPGKLNKKSQGKKLLKTA